jgi:hypothetical protein
MKRIYIRIVVLDGEREHTHHVLESTNCESVEFAVNWYLLHFWGFGTIEKRTYVSGGIKEYFVWFDGEITAKVETYKELTEEEYQTMIRIMY